LEVTQRDAYSYTVPKGHLIGGLEAKMHTGEFKIALFKNYALKSIDHVRQRLHEAILYVEHNPQLVKSITSFPYIAKSF
jgi:hypothetical protein